MMKKMMRTALMATMAFALLLLPACGGGSDDGAQAPAVEESSGAGTAAGEEVSTDFAPAVDGVLTLKMANAGIIINGTGVAMPYTFAAYFTAIISLRRNPMSTANITCR